MIHAANAVAGFYCKFNEAVVTPFCTPLVLDLVVREIDYLARRLDRAAAPDTVFAAHSL